ncbi:PKD-like family lipoprotein [Chitinophaga sp.]|uniref:PKD-like family lipoprotein n=1 Tax=Chitinophaga sp. TaxID=1869181 RepID=UPI0031E48377
MKNHLTIIICFLLLTACYKDKGNYDINMPPTPIVTGLDSIYNVVVGDSLIITPKVTISNTDSLALEWRISSPEVASGALNFTGPSLRMLFGLQSNLYTARLTVYNKKNGIRYYFPFLIQGITAFTAGTTVLSLDNGVTRLSFITPGGEVKPNIYETVNGHSLPPNPLALFYMKDKQQADMALGYWIVCKNGGRRLNVSSLQDDPTYPNTLAANFFSAPDTIVVGSMQQAIRGSMTGIINDKFYAGFTLTWNQAATYGMFGDYATGNYNLAPSFISTFINGQYSYIAFEKDKQQFVRISGTPYYYGTQYTTTSTTAFDPTNVGMSLIHMEQINSGDCFAYCKGSDGTVYELKFTVSFTNSPYTFTPVHKRAFIQQSLINENTKWQAAINGVLYLTSGEKVYRYNPLNQEVRALETSFNGNTVSMIKLSDNQDTLIAGAGNSLYYMDISTGKYGVLTKTITGIPGQPVDMAWRP